MRWSWIIRYFVSIPKERLAPVTAHTVLAYEKNPLLISSVAILLCGGVFDLLRWRISSPFNEVWGWDWHTLGIQISILCICVNLGVSICKNKKDKKEVIKEAARNNLESGVFFLILFLIFAAIGAA